MLTKKQAAAKAWYQKNKKLTIARAAAWAMSNRAKRKQIRDKWRKDNLSAARAVERASQSKNKAGKASYQRKYRTENPGVSANYCAKRRAKKLKATPSWLTEGDYIEMSWAYKLAKDRSTLSGVEYEVDHIVPLQGENVSGLHVPWNLQIITAKENQIKGNKFQC